METREELLLRQGPAARKRRALGARTRPQHQARRAVPLSRREETTMLAQAIFFWIFAAALVASASRGDPGAQPRAFGAVPHPGLRRVGGAVRAARRGVPGDDADRRLRRRGGGAVPVRHHAARRRFRPAQAGLRAISAGRRPHRGRGRLRALVRDLRAGRVRPTPRCPPRPRARSPTRARSGS